MPMLLPGGFLSICGKTHSHEPASNIRKVLSPLHFQLPCRVDHQHDYHPIDKFSGICTKCIPDQAQKCSAGNTNVKLQHTNAPPSRSHRGSVVRIVSFQCFVNTMTAPSQEGRHMRLHDEETGPPHLFDSRYEEGKGFACACLCFHDHVCPAQQRPKTLCLHGCTVLVA